MKTNRISLQILGIICSMLMAFFYITALLEFQAPGWFWQGWHSMTSGFLITIIVILIYHRLQETKEKSSTVDLFEKEYLKSIGYKVTKEDGQCGEAIDIKTNGMTKLAWNREGHWCTYFGDKLEKNVSFGLYKDGGTRTAFSGYIYDREQLELILKLTM